VADPRLAQVAATVASRTARAAWLLIGAAAFNLAARAWSLADAHSTAGRILGALSATFWLVYLAYGIRQRSRARRAEAANQAVLTHV
jgi:hypothetical protein